MIGFEEQAEHEKGFSKLWEKHIAPVFDDYRATYYKTRRKGRVTAALGIAGTLASLFFLGRFGAAVLLFPVVAMVAFFAVLRSFAPLLKARAEISDRFTSAVNEHFQDDLAPVDRRSALQDIFDGLAEEGMAPREAAKIGAAYASSDGSYQFFNATVRRETTSHQPDSMSEDNHTGQTTQRTFRYDHYLIMQFQLVKPVKTPIRIMPDHKIGKFFTKMTKNWNRVALENAAFEKHFEAYCDEEDLLRDVMREEVQAAFASMRDYYSKNRPRLKGKAQISCLIKGTEMSFVFFDLDDVAGTKLAGKTPEKLIEAAHTGLARMAEMVSLAKTYRNLMPLLK